MGKGTGAIVTILVIAAIAAGVIFGVPSVRARFIGVPLKLQFKVGQESNLKWTISGKVKGDLSGGLPANAKPPWLDAFLGKDITFTMDFRVKQVVKSVTGDIAEIEQSVEGGKYEITLPPANQKTSHDIDKAPPTTIKMDTQGRVQIDSSTAPPKGVKVEDWKKLQEFAASMASGSLPGDTRRIGQTWTQTVSLPVTNEQMKATISANNLYSFEGVDKKSNVTVADILAKQDLKVEMSGGQQGVEFKLNGTIQGPNHNYFDWAAGQIVGTDGAFTFNVNVVLNAPLMNAKDVKAQLSGDVKVIMEKL